MFKLNEEVTTKGGYIARIICVDANYKYNSKTCSIVALVTVPAAIAATGQACYFYTTDGKYSGTGNAAYDLVSSEPTEAEVQLIAEIRALGTEPNARDADERMLKVIRKLRAKS